MKKIAIVGGPSTGKTTLINETAKALKERGFRVKIIKDPAWDFIVNFDEPENLSDQYHILGEWREREKKIRRKNLDFLFYDGAPFLSYVYSFLYESPEENQKARAKFQWIKEKIWQDIRKEMINTFPLRFKEESFHLLFYLPVEFPARPAEGRRYLERQEEISLSIRAFLDTYLWQDPRWFVIRGSLKERVNKVLEIILRPC